MELSMPDNSTSQTTDQPGTDTWHDTVEIAPFGAFRTTIDGHILYVNPELARMLEYESPDELKNSIEDIAEDLLRSPDQRRELLGQLERSGFVEGFVYDVKTKNGNLRKVTLTVRRVENGDGKGTYLEGLIQDITEEVETASRLES